MNMTGLKDTKKRKRIRLFRKNKKEVGKVTRSSSKSVKVARDMASNVNVETSNSETNIERK